MLKVVGGLSKSDQFETTRKHLDTTTHVEEVGVPMELEWQLELPFPLYLYVFSKLLWQEM